MNDDWSHEVRFKFYDPWEGDERWYVTWVGWPEASTDESAIRAAKERLKEELLYRLDINETRVRARP